LSQASWPIDLASVGAPAQTLEPPHPQCFTPLTRQTALSTGGLCIDRCLNHHPAQSHNRRRVARSNCRGWRAMSVASGALLPFLSLGKSPCNGPCASAKLF
jgi:hypothetical protein